LRRLDPRRDPRRLGVVAAVPGDSREARHGLRGLQLRLRVRRTPGQSGSTSGTREDNLAEALSDRAEQIADIADGGACARASSRGRRRTCRAACLLSMSRPRRT
jgi:hypothetical protein